MVVKQGQVLIYLSAGIDVEVITMNRVYSIEVPKDKNPVSFYYEKTILEKHSWKVLHRMFNTSLLIIEVED